MAGIKVGIVAVGLLALLAPSACPQGAIGFEPVIGTIPEGVQLDATPVVSADRRYVRLTTNPQFLALGGFENVSVPAGVVGGGGFGGGFDGGFGGGLGGFGNVGIGAGSQVPGYGYGGLNEGYGPGYGGLNPGYGSGSGYGGLNPGYGYGYGGGSYPYPAPVRRYGSLVRPRGPATVSGMDPLIGAIRQSTTRRRGR